MLCRIKKKKKKKKNDFARFLTKNLYVKFVLNCNKTKSQV